MNISEQNEPTSRVCRYIGLLEDSDTAQIYPSKGHRCYRNETAFRVKLDYQAAYCMSSRHVDCPIFQGSEVAAMPRARRNRIRTEKKRGWLRPVLITVGALALVGVLGWLGYYLGFYGPNAKAAAPIPTASPRATQTAAPVVLPPQPTATNTPTPLPTSTQTATPEPPTLTPTPTQVPHVLETPIGTTAQLVIHQVREGDTLNSLAQAYSTTVEAIQAVNNAGSFPLQANTLLIVPYHLASANGLPVFQVVQVKADISIEDLANQLAVEVSSLMLYNNVQAGEILSANDLILVPQLPAPTG